MLCRHFKYDFQAMRNADKEDLVAVDGIGEVLAEAWIQFFQNEKNNKITDRLLAELLLPPAPEEEEEAGAGSGLAGLTFVITGSVERFKNRKELQELIEERGGKVTGSVTAKTSYLINNDAASSSSKNKKARELNIPIITEDEFIGQFIPGSSEETD